MTLINEFFKGKLELIPVVFNLMTIKFALWWTWETHNFIVNKEKLTEFITIEFKGRVGLSI